MNKWKLNRVVSLFKEKLNEAGKDTDSLFELCSKMDQALGLSAWDGKKPLEEKVKDNTLGEWKKAMSDIVSEDQKNDLLNKLIIAFGVRAQCINENLICPEIKPEMFLWEVL